MRPTSAEYTSQWYRHARTKNRKTRAQQITHKTVKENKNNHAHIRNKFKYNSKGYTWQGLLFKSKIVVPSALFQTSLTCLSDFCRICETTSWVVDICSLVVVALKTDIGVCIWSHLFCCKFLHISPVEICKRRMQDSVVCYCPSTESSQSWSWSLPFCRKRWSLQSHFPLQCLR